MMWNEDLCKGRIEAHTFGASPSMFPLLVRRETVSVFTFEQKNMCTSHNHEHLARYQQDWHSPFVHSDTRENYV